MTFRSSIPFTTQTVSIDQINTKMNIYIVLEYSHNAIQNSILHEFGHALGYIGHAPSNVDIMWAGLTEDCVLTENEINHLAVAYGLFNE